MSFSVLKAPTKPLFFIASNGQQEKPVSSNLHFSQVQKASVFKPLLTSSSLINKKPIRAVRATQKIDKPLPSFSSSAMESAVSDEKLAFPIMVNGCTGKMGKAIIEAGVSAGLQVVPVSFGSESKSGQIVEVGGKQFKIYGPTGRESILNSLFKENPNMIVIDYTVPDVVNANAELYSKVGVPFVMGTTGGDRDMLYNTVEASKGYAVISPQMGKQVVAFIAAMGIMAEQFPGAFCGYSLEVMESHQASKLDPSGTAKEVIKCFQKLGISYAWDQMQKIRDPEQQREIVGVPEEHLSSHAFHMYHLTSPDKTVSFEFQHNVCGVSIYAEGAIDAAIFLAKKVRSKADKRIYDMIDVLREGSKEETFFDSQAWLDSDCDDFYSVNGDFTPSASRGSSRGSTPLHLTSFMGTPQRAKSPISEKAFSSIPETCSTETKKRKKLADLFRDSFDAGKASDDQNPSGKPLIANAKLEIEKTNNFDGLPKSVRGTPVLSETNSVSGSERSPDRIPKPEKEKLTNAVRRCLPKMIPSCSSAERKKRHSMSPVQNGGGAYISTVA